MLIIANEVEIIRGDEIELRDVDWLWYPYIPFGKITLIQGDPGDGKSTFVLNLAAMLTVGMPLPFTETYGPLKPMTVIYQNTEDDAADTVMPRFLQAGGDHLLHPREGKGTDLLRQSSGRGHSPDRGSGRDFRSAVLVYRQGCFSERCQ